MYVFIYVYTNHINVLSFIIASWPVTERLCNKYFLILSSWASIHLATTSMCFRGLILIRGPRGFFGLLIIDVYTHLYIVTTAKIIISFLFQSAVCSRSGVYHDGRCYENVRIDQSSWLTDWKRCHDMGHILPVITSPDVEDFIRSSFFYWKSAFYIGTLFSIKLTCFPMYM